MASQFLPVLMVLVLAVLTAAGMLALPALMAQRSLSKSPMKRDTYECGVPLLDRAEKRVSVKFYLVALVFVALDVEVAFLYPWAVTYRSFLAGRSMTVFWDMLAFTVLLAVGYVYLWRKDVFDWSRRKPAAGSSTGRSES